MLTNRNIFYLAKPDVLILLAAFAISRILVAFAGVEMDTSALLKNWQYLSVDTLQNNLLKGIWYDHTQPPLFNLFLGLVVKIFGIQWEAAFIIIFKIISLVNIFLLYFLLRRVVQHKQIPLIISLVYALSPGTILFENELFYTSFMSLLLLAAAYFLLSFSTSLHRKKLIAFFVLLFLICLTRSIYHFIWLGCGGLLLFGFYRKKVKKQYFLLPLSLCLIVLMGWYFKNYLLFGSFSTSTWSGMNLARNVFHDFEVKDSSRIEAIEPFSNISFYNKFRNSDFEKKYTGLNDTDLIAEFKNGEFLNEKHIGYITVSQQYLNACKIHIKINPASYAKNVLQSGIIFFAPATRYSVNEKQAKKLKFYDLIYSFNLSQLANGKQERRLALVASAAPKLLCYLFVIGFLLRNYFRKRRIDILSLFILCNIAYTFCISSFFEHYENMRFRYEAEPLFLILVGIVANQLVNRKTQKAT